MTPSSCSIRGNPTRWSDHQAAPRSSYVTKWMVGHYDWGLDAQAATDLGNFGAQASATTQLLAARYA
jgi:hypothetical protein